MYEEKNNNSHQTSQVLLSVLAVAILVVAVVGVSFAFFTYSRQGTTTNTINTGTLVFKYEENENGIKLTNAMPMSDEEATKANALGDKGQFDFTVTSTINGNMSIKYDIVVDDTTDHASVSALESKYVRLRLLTKTSDAEGDYTPINIESTHQNSYFDKLENYTRNGSSNSDKLLYTNTFDQTSGEKTHYYRFQMWLSDHYYTTNLSADGYKELSDEIDTNKTYMTNDFCTTSSDSEDTVDCSTCNEEHPNLDDDTCKLKTRGTNGKTFSVKLDVYAVDTPSYK